MSALPTLAITTVTTLAALLAATPALAHESTTVTISTPSAGAVIGTAFPLSGTVAEGGGSLGLTIDGKHYLTAEQRRDPGITQEGTLFGETPAGTTNAPFSVTLDLNGTNVVASGENGQIREGVAPGRHVLKVCQYYGEHTGCGEITVTVAGSQPGQKQVAPTKLPEATVSQRTSATPSPSPTTAASVAPAAQVKASNGVSPAWAVAGLTVLGLLIVLITHRFSPHRGTHG